jgi:hypothetical protein
MLSMRALILGLGLALGVGLAGGSATAAPRGPACTPATLNSSSLKGSSVTVSPVSGARDASPRTQISFLGAPASELSVLSVRGSRTGAHSGRLLAYSQRDGASFVPDRPFAEGERVTVRARLRGPGRPQSLLDQFAIATQDTLTTTPEAIHPGSAVQRFHSRPDLQPPALTVTAHAPGTAPGDIFVAPYSGPGQAGPMILDENGGLVWFKPLPTHTSATNLRVQEYGGEPVLTWWQGDISVHGFGRGEGVIADSAYNDIAHVRAGNGQQADLHELQLTPDGRALITAYEPVVCDLSSVGGPAYGAVTDGALQEIDVKTGLVMFEWTSLDHVALSESYARPQATSTRTPFDFFHINSINLDGDGTLMISARNTWAVYDIDASSGQIAWRLGGKRSSFAAGPGTRTAWQHDPRQLPGGLISLFDNGASPRVHSQSRGLVLSLGEGTKETLVAQFAHTPPLVAESQGNLQALANGDWFVGWGQEPYFSEFSPSGAAIFDAHFPPHEQSYRSFRFPWSGTPAHRPVFAFAASRAHGGTVYASWNGATGVASWRVLAGARAGALHAIATAPRAGFETALTLPGPVSGPYLAVQALDAAGHVLGASLSAPQPGLE